MKHLRLSIVSIALIAVIGAYFLGRAGAQRANRGDVEKSEIASGSKGLASAEEKTDNKKLRARRLPSAIANSSAPLPPADAPLKAVFVDLQARADAGDAAAASRLSRDLARCERLPSVIWRNARTTESITSRKTDGMNEAQLRTYQAMLDSMEVRQQEVQKAKDLCAGVDQSMLDSLVPSLARAAELGDVDARACYLSSGPAYELRSMLNHPELLQNYRDSASAIVEAGLSAGDWRTVDLLKSAYEPGGQGMLASVVGADPVQYYRYLKLYRLGAETFRAAALDQQLAAAAAGLNPEQVVAGDQWAQTTLQNNFHGPSTAATPQGWNPCAGIGN